MTVRTLSALGLALALALPAAAQSPTYSTLDDERSSRTGVRIGIGGGASLYSGPDILYDAVGQEQDRVSETNPAVTAFVSFPLGSDLVRGRLLGGLLNLGAEPRLDSPAGANPFLTNENALVEADLMLHLAPPSGVSPYVYSGFGAIIADPFGQDEVSSDLDRDRVAYVIPVGVGLDLPITRNVSLFGEASYRFGLNSVGESPFGTAGKASPPCEVGSTDPACKPCLDDPTLPFCSGADPDDDKDFSTRIGGALFTGGLKLGFGRAPAPVAYIPPAPTPLPTPAPPVVVTPIEVEEPKVCELVELNSIYFDYGSSTLSPRAQSLLDENVDLLLESDGCCVFVDGYTDASEAGEYGLALSGRRAQAVYDYYLSRRIAASRIQLRNEGQALPACDKEDPGRGCERNRRVESIPLDCERFEYLLDNPSYDPY